MAGQGIGRGQRVRRRSEFQAIRQHGLSRSSATVVMLARPNDLPYVRFGFVVGKRVARLAVTRNRTRRRLREVASRLSLRAGWDVLLIARRDAVGVPFAELQTAVGGLAAKLGLLKQNTHMEFAAV